MRGKFASLPFRFEERLSSLFRSPGREIVSLCIKRKVRSDFVKEMLNLSSIHSSQDLVVVRQEVTICVVNVSSPDRDFGDRAVACILYHRLEGLEATIEFVVDEQGKVLGLGLFGTVGAPTVRERSGKTVQERAEAWFTKV